MPNLLQSYRSAIDRCARGRTVFVLVAVMLLVYGYMLVYSIPRIMAYAGGMKLFDMLPTGYSFEYAQMLLNALGPDGRNAYLTRQIPIDLVYPALFAVSCSLLSVWMLRKVFSPRGWIFGLSLIPVLASVFDYFENFGVAAMLLSYPDLSSSLVKASCIFSVAKAGLTTVFFVVLILGGIFVLSRRSASQ